MRSHVLAAATLLLGATAAPAQAAPNVVATILPVQSLAAAVMAGVGEPELLLAPGTSPHAYALKPSEAAMLEEAELVLWIGPALETFLADTLATVAHDAHRLVLMDAPGMTLLAGRAGGAWDAHDHDHAHDHGQHDHGEHDHGDETAAVEAHDEHGHDEHGHDEGADAAGAHDHTPEEHGDVDAHVWLAPANAIAMTRAIADELAHLDPANAPAYAANAAATIAELEALTDELAAELEPVAGTPFIVFHDAYPYFEDAFGLNAVGSVTISPEQQPGTGQVAELRAKIERLEAACVFAEPQFPPRLVETLVAGTPARMGTLDPIGSDLAPGADAYPQLMRDLAGSLVDCLAAAS